MSAGKAAVDAQLALEMLDVGTYLGTLFAALCAGIGRDYTQTAPALGVLRAVGWDRVGRAACRGGLRCGSRG